MIDPLGITHYSTENLLCPEIGAESTIYAIRWSRRRQAQSCLISGQFHSGGDQVGPDIPSAAPSGLGDNRDDLSGPCRARLQSAGPLGLPKACRPLVGRRAPACGTCNESHTRLHLRIVRMILAVYRFPSTVYLLPFTNYRSPPPIKPPDSARTCHPDRSSGNSTHEPGRSFPARLGTPGRATPRCRYCPRTRPGGGS